MRSQRLGEPTRAQVDADADARRRAVLHGASRVHVLEILRAAGAPLSVTEVAGRVGLHPNTVRWHLYPLAEAGWVTRATEPRGGPGRPRALYAARGDAFPSDGEDGSERGYRLLADILASYLAGASPDPAAEAGNAGRAWGRYLTDKPAPFARLSPVQAAERVVEMLDDLGFAPDPDPASGRITLHACPFREVAESHPEVVCAVHLGLMQGALAELGTPALTTRLERFVTARQCRVHVVPDPAALTAEPASRRREVPAAQHQPRARRSYGNSGGVDP